MASKHRWQHRAVGRGARYDVYSTTFCGFVLQTMRPEMFDAQSNQQHVPNLPHPVGAVSDVRRDNGETQALSCVYPVMEPPTPPSVTLHPTTYYVPTLGLGVSAPAAVTTSTTPWPPTQYIAQSVSRPIAGTYGTPPKPEMAFLFPVCMPSSEAGHVMSPTVSVGRSASLVSTPPSTSGLNPLMNSTKYVVLLCSFPPLWDRSLRHDQALWHSLYFKLRR